MDNEIDRKIDVTALIFLLVQNRQQTHDWTLIRSGANGLDIQEWMGAIAAARMARGRPLRLEQTNGSSCLRNCTFEKLWLVKIPLGSCYIGKCFWEHFYNILYIILQLLWVYSVQVSNSSLISLNYFWSRHTILNSIIWITQLF